MRHEINSLRALCMAIEEANKNKIQDMNLVLKWAEQYGTHHGVTRESCTVLLQRSVGDIVNDALG